MKDLEDQLAQLKRENKQLRDRMQEAMDIIDAIQSGEVDAIVAKKPLDEYILSIQGNDTTPFESIENHDFIEKNKNHLMIKLSELLLKQSDMAKRNTELLKGLKRSQDENLLLKEQVRTYAQLLEQGRLKT
jgi:cell shape-determining protein MreC